MPSNIVSSEKEIFDTENIYKHYKSTLSEVIAYIEVYEHDLPTEVMAQIAELLQAVAIFVDSNNLTEREDMSRLLRQVDLKVTQSLYKHAICLLIKEIEENKKVFRRFKYKGVMLENRNFFEVAKEIEQEIIADFCGKMKKCYKGTAAGSWRTMTMKERMLYWVGYVKISTAWSFSFLKKEPYLPINNLLTDNFDDENLENVYQETKELLQLYERVMPKVIGNGSRQSIGMSVFVAATGWVIPALLAIPVIMRVVDLVKVLSGR